MQVASHLAGRAFLRVPSRSCPCDGPSGLGNFWYRTRPNIGHDVATVMRFNLEVVSERYGEVGLALGVSPQPLEAISAIEALSEKVGTDKTLTDLGATKNDLEHLTTDALRDLIILNTPRYPNRDDVRRLYELAL